jgi:hypothetical protein
MVCGRTHESRVETVCAERLPIAGQLCVQLAEGARRAWDHDATATAGRAPRQRWGSALRQPAPSIGTHANELTLLERPRRPPSSTERRRDLIRNRIVDNGSVRIDELAEEFGVTIMTIHRDLNVLEEQGWVRKIRGGATVDPSAAVDGSVPHRMSVQLM